MSGVDECGRCEVVLYCEECVSVRGEVVLYYVECVMCEVVLYYVECVRCEEVKWCYTMWSVRGAILCGVCEV